MNLYSVMILLFYLIGCLVSIFIMIKYANIIELINYMNSIDEIQIRTFGLFFITCAIISYTFMSWVGAIATYIIFYKKQES